MDFDAILFYAGARPTFLLELGNEDSECNVSYLASRREQEQSMCIDDSCCLGYLGHFAVWEP